MMNTFKLLLQSSGLSAEEASNFLEVSIDTVESWLSAKDVVSENALETMSDLIDQQNQETDVALKDMEHVLKLSSTSARVALQISS